MKSILAGHGRFASLVVAIVLDPMQDVPSEVFRMARHAANPYEALDDPAFNPFLNRSALKLANLDSILEVKN